MPKRTCKTCYYIRWTRKFSGKCHLDNKTKDLRDSCKDWKPRSKGLTKRK